MPNKIIGLFVLLLGGFSQFGVNLSPVVAQGETSLQSDASAACDANWQGEIDAIIQRPEFARAQWGILVRSLDAERSIYALNEHRYFLGASTVKLLTTAAALERLGADYRIRTPFYTLGQPPVLETLLVAGRGDPSLSTENLSAIARQLYRQGVRQIDQLIADDRFFSEPHRSLTWEWGDLFFYYAPAVNSLILNQNRFSLTFSPQQIGDSLNLSWRDEIAAAQWQLENSTLTSPAGTSNRLAINGSLGQPLLEIRGTLAVDASPLSWNLAILNPRRYFLESLQASLEDEGIQVRQARLARPEDSTNDFAELTAIASPPLAILLQETNRSSNNLYAEALLLTLGAVAGDRGSRTAGLDVVRNTLTQLGVDPDSYLLADGSGLSRHNLVSP
ncbi:MAG: D-alanyl-D-alanine carboxypeptidase/D-alanyl-D-alanine-endopeptidase, partial [Cyanobacteriota bacterium]|nr:D-alanyl-D-alanine carboxypeptidase/D-alanyl-D-alanine-endopeptidase [Cyanobacteriota bacterium]